MCRTVLLHSSVLPLSMPFPALPPGLQRQLDKVVQGTEEVYLASSSVQSLSCTWNCMQGDKLLQRALAHRSDGYYHKRAATCLEQHVKARICNIAFLEQINSRAVNGSYAAGMQCILIRTIKVASEGLAVDSSIRHLSPAGCTLGTWLVSGHSSCPCSGPTHLAEEWCTVPLSAMSLGLLTVYGL